MGTRKGKVFIIVNLGLFILGFLFSMLSKLMQFGIFEGTKMSLKEVLAGNSIMIMFIYICFSINYLIVRNEDRQSKTIAMLFSAMISGFVFLWGRY